MITPTIAIAIALSFGGGVGGVALHCYCNRAQDVVEVQPHNGDNNLERVFGDIVEHHIQRNSEDSDTELDIKINIHTHHKEKE